MNKQEIFDTVLTHLRTQGKKAVMRIGDTNMTSCAYRGEENLRCAVGVFIIDEQYRKEMEGNSIDELLNDGDFDLPHWMHEHKDLLGALQGLHDNAENWTKKGFAAEYVAEHIAAQYDLEYHC